MLLLIGKQIYIIFPLFSKLEREGSPGRGGGGGGKVRVMTKMLKLEALEVLSWSNEHFFVYYIRCEVYSIRIAFRRLNFVLL